jgi:hypothetical protein
VAESAVEADRLPAVAMESSGPADPLDFSRLRMAIASLDEQFGASPAERRVSGR